jgi:hypothetical protein
VARKRVLESQNIQTVAETEIRRNPSLQFARRKLWTVAANLITSRRTRSST